MKNYFYLVLFALLPLMFACGDDDKEEVYKTYAVTVKLNYPEEIEPVAEVPVLLSGATDYVSKTNAEGIASFNVPAGVYEISVTDKRGETGYMKIYNAVKSNVVISDQGSTGNDVVFSEEITLSESTTTQLVIKELYVSGISYVNEEDGKAKTFHMDKYVVIYNNSGDPAVLDDLCLAIVLPYNSTATNKDYVDGVLFYESEGWIPAGTGVWYFTSGVTLEPGKQIVIALNNAVDNTATYPASVNLGKAEYYCTYDIESYPNVTYYPAPSANIPTSHYLNAHHYGTGNAWPLSNTSPAFFIFVPQDVTLANFVADASLTDLYGGSDSQVRKRVKDEWVLDAVEVYEKGSDKNMKRLTSKIDAGYLELTKSAGYSVYRNVDAEATKAIGGNEAKLVMGYADDPSGIDAEASIKNGARIVYKDTNNSSSDFHERKKASIKE